MNKRPIVYTCMGNISKYPYFPDRHGYDRRYIKSFNDLFDLKQFNYWKELLMENNYNKK
jgi:hypothetical protein